MDSGQREQENEDRSPQSESLDNEGADTRSLDASDIESGREGTDTDSGDREEDRGVSRAGREAAPSPQEQRLLDRAFDCYEQGDFRQARRLAGKLLQDGVDETIRAEAQSLLDRTGPDRLAVVLGILCLLLILVLGAVYL